MAIPDWLKPAIQDRYTGCCGSNDYGGFVDWINELHKGGQIEDTDVDEILEAFDQTPIPEVEPDDEEGVISYITDPPTLGQCQNYHLKMGQGVRGHTQDDRRQAQEDARDNG